MSCFLICGSITLTLLVILLSIFAYYVYNLRTNNVFQRMGMPGPPPVPLLGEVWYMMRKGVNVSDMELVKKYGKIIGVHQGTTPIILLTDLDLLRNVLIRDSHTFINRRSIETGIAGPFDYGLVALKDEQWKNARTIVSPTFSTAKLKAMYGLINQISDIYNQRLLEYADKQEIFDIKVLNSSYTLDNIASCMFGIETNSLQDENARLAIHLKKFFKLGLRALMYIVLFISPRLAAFLQNFGLSIMPLDALDYVTNVVNQVLARRRQHLERRNDFIQIMVDCEEEEKETEQKEEIEQTDKQGQQWGKLKKTLTDKEILGQALIFLVAAFETTSVLMSFFFYVMAIQPAIQEKVYEEIRQEIGDDEITHEKLSQLTYLDMAINETLRMYPPLIRYDRVASQDYQLGKYLIKKGSIVNVPVYPIHHDPVTWPDPEEFIPERFSPTEKANRHPMAFLPFGEGPRSCVGMRFALLEAKLAIAKAIRLVEFQRCEKTEIPIQLGKIPNLNSRNPIWLRVVRRSQ